MKDQILSSSPGMAQEASMSTSAPKAHQMQQGKMTAHGPQDLSSRDLSTRVTTRAAQIVWTQAKQCMGLSEGSGQTRAPFLSTEKLQRKVNYASNCAFTATY